MKKIYILKPGSTFSNIKDKFGDFEDFVIRNMDISKKLTIVIDNFDDPDYSYDNIAGVIITGSHEMITDNPTRVSNISKMIINASKYKIPILGICYGSQIIASAFGGSIDYNPNGIEIGTVPIRMIEDYNNDLLFNIYPQSFLGHVTHRQSITKLPPEATRLAFNDFENYHAVSFRENQIWGVQFHPEFNAEIIHMYIDEQKNVLIKESFDINSLHSSVLEHNYGSTLLKRFFEICNI